MSEVALYRKYRPKTFNEVKGQDHIVSVLQGAIKEGNISHAYLFAGSRGTGKTSVARVFASVLGVSPNDMYEIDAASNRGIDDIRELREAVNILPLESPYKVYIIDEVHMLTREAFNALLKTLEEPPRHVIFILATTEEEKLPETIISRCQSFTFKKPSQTLLRDFVVSVAKKEGFTLEKSSAELVALLAEGSFRDAHGALQKVISSSSDKKISIEEVERIMGAPQGRLINDCVEAIADKDLEKGLAAIGKAVEQNIDMKLFLKLLLHKVRCVLLLQHAKSMATQIGEQLSDEDFTLLESIAERKVITPDMLMVLLEAHMATGRSYVPQLPLELALVKICQD